MRRTNCEDCGKPIEQPGRGRPRLFCSVLCKNRATKRRIGPTRLTWDAGVIAMPFMDPLRWGPKGPGIEPIIGADTSIPVSAFDTMDDEGAVTNALLSVDPDTFVWHSDASEGNRVPGYVKVGNEHRKRAEKVGVYLRLGWLTMAQLRAITDGLVR